MEVEDVNDVNMYLEEGWELLKIADRTTWTPDGSRLQSSIVYILGRREVAKAEKVERKPEVKKPEVDASMLEKLPFKPYEEGSESGWIWADPEKHEKSVRDIVAWLRGKVEREGKVTVGRFTYTFSGPPQNPTMFISRRPVEVK
jgi:hypothetical protein